MESNEFEPLSLLGEQKLSWREVLKNLAFIALAVGVAYWVTVYIGLDGLREKAESAGVYAPLIIILLKATTLVVVPLGGTPIYPVAGALFGFWKGLGITLVGDALGSAISFYISRRFGRALLHFFMSAQQAALVEKLVERVSKPAMFIKARIFFMGFPDLFAYAAGLTRINLLFFLAVHIGVHSFFAGLWVKFGDILVSGNVALIMGVSICFTVLALAGVWLFRADIKSGS